MDVNPTNNPNEEPLSTDQPTAMPPQASDPISQPNPFNQQPAFEQPVAPDYTATNPVVVPTSEPTATPVMNTFSTAEPVAAPITNGFTATPEVVSAPQGVEPVAAQPFFAAQPQAPVATPSKKKSKLIWIIPAIIVVIIGGLVASYFIVKGGLDKTADTYTSAEKSYLNQVYDATNSSTATPVEMQTAIAKLNQPTLASSSFSSLSPKYASAQTLEKNAADKLKTFNGQMSSFVSLYNFEKSYTTLNGKLQDIINASTFDASTLATTFGILKQLQTTIDAAQPPTELKADFSNYSNGWATIVADWSSAVTAYNNSDRTAYVAALTKYTADYENKVQVPEAAISTYYSNITDKFGSVQTDFKTYVDSIK